MKRLFVLILLACSITARAQLAGSQPSATRPSPASEPASGPTSFAQSLYDRVTPSLVAVHFTWAYEFGRIELVGPGVVVSEDGLVMLPGEVIAPNLPTAQLTDFKVIVPGEDKDDDEIDATFEGRDERNNVSFVRAKAGSKWTPVHFEDLPVTIGDPLYSVGILAKAAGYRAFLTSAIVSARVRGEFPQVLVSGALSAPGGVVFDGQGRAVGFVNTPQHQLMPYLYTSSGRREIDPMAPLANPPHLFTLTSEFSQSLSDPPSHDKPIKLSWLGLPQLAGVPRDVAVVFGLENQPAIEIGDVLPDSPAAAAGLKTRQKIVKLNGKPLVRGDEPDELPMILHRQLAHYKPGEKVTFSVMTKKGAPMEDVTVTLAERPKEPSEAKRFYADDLGFGVREITFVDSYSRKKPANFPGVVVTLLKPSGAAQSAKLGPEDLITDVNNTPVTDLDQFIQTYQGLRKDKPKDAIVLVVLKGDGSTQTIRVEPPQ